MKTIIITSFHSLISRNILSSGLLNILATKLRVVVLVPDFKKNYFIKEFAGENIIVEGIKKEMSRRDLFFRKLALFFCPTKSLRIKYRAEFLVNKKLFYFFVYLPLSLLGHFKIFIEFLRWLDFYYPHQNLYQHIFVKYQPDLIFSTDIQNELDVNLLQEAKKRNKKIISMVRSWDNLTAKGIVRIVPDQLIVNNEIIKSEAIKHGRIPANKIVVVGIPHYDNYLVPPQKTKEEFFSAAGFDLNKKLILFAPIGNRYIKNNKTDKAVLTVLSTLDVNILVRMPPGDSVDWGDFSPQKARVVFDQPGVRSWSGGIKTNELSRRDDRRLCISLCYTDAVVGGPSTIMIDAAVFDKPVVLVNFKEGEQEYFASINRYYDYDHIRPLINSGGVKLANNSAKLTDLVKTYLLNSRLDKEGRQRIAAEQTYKLDGQSTNRLSRVLLTAVGE